MTLLNTITENPNTKKKSLVVLVSHNLELDAQIVFVK